MGDTFSECHDEDKYLFMSPLMTNLEINNVGSKLLSCKFS